MFGIGRKKRARKVISGFSEILHEMATEEGDITLHNNVLVWRANETDVEIFFPQKDGDIGILHTSTPLTEGMLEVRRFYFTHTGILTALKVLLTHEEASEMDNEMLDLYANTNYELGSKVNDDDQAYFFQTIFAQLDK